MLIAVGVLVVALAGLVYSVWVNWELGLGVVLCWGLLTAFFSTALGAVVALILSLILSPIVGYDTLYQHRSLVALTDERTAIGGSFFLGFGTVGSSATYTFYVAEDNGARQMYQEPSAGVLVFEDTDQPYAVWVSGCKSRQAWLVQCLITDDIGELREIHVPKNSIRTGIQMGVPKP